jgi:hypothetical protein
MKVAFKLKVGLLIVANSLLAVGSFGQTKLPAVPIGVTAAPGNSEIGLRWSAVAGATSYHLKRSTSNAGNYTQIAAPTFAGYTDVGVKNGATYYYVVSAVGAAGESENSAQVSANPRNLLLAPAGLGATDGDGEVALRWSPVTGATGYHLKRATASGGPYVQIAAPWWNGYTDAGATNGATYFYVVSTVGAGGEGANSAAVTAKPAAPATRLSVSFFGQSVSEIQASHFPTIPLGGVRLWDTNTTWAQIETSSGTYSWTELDTWLRSVSGHGNDSMYTFGRVPHWAAMDPSQACPNAPVGEACAAPPPADVDSGDNTWKTFVTALVRHSLSSPELHIAYYEMWNEPDLKRNWSGTPAQLVTMAKDAYAIIQALDPGAKLVGPTASTANQYGVHFLPDYYAAGGATAQDIVGLHAYLYAGSGFSTSPAGITTSISQLQKLMATYQISNKPIWFTEGNWNGDGLGTLTDAQKAAYLAQEYMLMWSTDAVARYYWYSWDSKVGTLWVPATGLTPAGTAYNELAAWLIDSTHSANPCSTASDGTWTCALKLSTGYPAEIIWNPDVSKTIPVGAAFATLRTLTSGTVQSIAGHQVAIGSLPVLIIGSQTAP